MVERKASGTVVDMWPAAKVQVPTVHQPEKLAVRNQCSPHQTMSLFVYSVSILFMFSGQAGKAQPAQPFGVTFVM